MTARRLVRACFALALLSSSCARDERTPHVQGARCTQCAITLDQVGVFSDSFEPGVLPDYMVYASRDSARRIYVISRSRTAVLVYAENGAFLRRLGNAGSGPGEYRVIRRVLHGPGDSVFVTDWGLGRVTVYSPDLNVARTQAIAHQPDLLLADGSFIIADQIGTRDRIGYPLHRAARDGAILTSFGADTPQYRPDLRLITTRWAAPSRTGGIWTVAPGRYVIEHWDEMSGQRTRRIAVASDWFTEVSSWPSDETMRPPAVIETLWEGDVGVLWVLLRDADLEWRPPPRANIERPMGAEEYERTYDWILEAIDTASGTVVASRRFRYILWARPGSRVLVTADTLTADRSIYNVWEPRLISIGGGQ